MTGTQYAIIKDVLRRLSDQELLDLQQAIGHLQGLRASAIEHAKRIHQQTDKPGGFRE
jgi:hypothetical protein